MDDERLKQLHRLPVPPVDAAAKDRAKQLAMQAFAEAQKKNASSSQGSFLTRRLKGITTFLNGSIEMHKRWLASGVALGALAAVMIGTGVWQRQLERQPEGQPVTAVEMAQDEEAVGDLAAPMAEHAPIEQAPMQQASPAGSASREEMARGDVAADASSAAPPMAMMQRAAPSPVRMKTRDSAALYEGGANPGMGMAPPSDGLAVYPPAESREQFASAKRNALKVTAEEPVSTFSIDVDTASYSFVRRLLNQGQLPSPEMVRIEEMVNYFDYDYPAPKAGEAPFKPTVAVYPTPWNPKTRLLHIGLQGQQAEVTVRPKANLVFLVDVSGSMAEPDKLPLLKNALRLMVENLQADDRVAIVTYAGASGVVLEPTAARDKAKIFSALEGLESGGSTAGAAGIETAYQLAEAHLDKEGINRVILATDGDFNVGIHDPEALKKLIEKKREGGVTLSVLGFGRGNYQDELMQSLAQHGNGQAAYIDTLNEARKLLVEEASSTLFTIAKDVKIQVEFNPETVAEYRLIGYETRHLERQDFNNDKVDAGDIGSGHQVTAIYEITPKGSGAELTDPLRYGADPVVVKDGRKVGQGEYGFLKLRYKQPNATRSRLLSQPVTPAAQLSLEEASDDVRFAAAVAAFGQKLRGEPEVSDFRYEQIIALATAAKGEDPFGYRAEAIHLMRLAASLDHR